MRILLSSTHRYPADRGESAGPRTKENPSGAPQVVHDLLARGLAELGHQVFYLLEGIDAPLPGGVTWVAEPPDDVDVCHNVRSDRRPWIDMQHGYWPDDPGHDHLVCVSRSLAELMKVDRYVLNGLDPEEYVFSETKGDYFVFMAAMQTLFGPMKYYEKGLDIALQVARDLGIELRIAGSTLTEDALALVRGMCEEHGAVFLGDVRGRRKAELLAGARAVFFPTRRREGCPLTVIEALMSGTPVIASDVGVCHEIVTPEVGFVCSGPDDYRHAVEHLGQISPRACRERAVSVHHYRTMARGYVEQYEEEIRRRQNGLGTYAEGFTGTVPQRTHRNRPRIAPEGEGLRYSL